MIGEKKGGKGKTLLMVGMLLYAMGFVTVAHYEPLNELRVGMEKGLNETYDTTLGMMMIGATTTVIGLGMIALGSGLLALTERQWDWGNWRKPRNKDEE